MSEGTSEGMTPQQRAAAAYGARVFEAISTRAESMLRVAFMEAGWSWDEPLFHNLLKPVLGVGIAAASEHYGLYPEDLAIAGQPSCATCGEAIQTLQAGLVSVEAEDGARVTKVAWPCGHTQPRSG